MWTSANKHCCAYRKCQLCATLLFLQFLVQSACCQTCETSKEGDPQDFHVTCNFCLSHSSNTWHKGGDLEDFHVNFCLSHNANTWQKCVRIWNSILYRFEADKVESVDQFLTNETEKFLFPGKTSVLVLRNISAWTSTLHAWLHLLQDIFLWVLQFSPLLKTNIYKFWRVSPISALQ